MTAIGDRVGSYVIERELGRGGMGVVYEARHSILGHRVALKLLHPELSRSDEVVHRFFNEARAAAAIAHPGIVAIHDVGITDAREAYLVMELLPGESLAQRLKDAGPLPVALAVTIARQVAAALAAAHAIGIVHRDLKPDNIFLVPAPTPGEVHVRLLDFGVAKLTGELGSGDLRTKTGALLGTPHYMSPEQCDGEREIDHRSDLYALGCVMFQMIAGRLPFEGGLGAVIGMHLHVPPPSLHAEAPAVPSEIDAIVGRLLAKDPAARFASAAQLIEAIDRWAPTHADHVPAASRRIEMSTAETMPSADTLPVPIASSETLPAARTDETVASLVPQSRREPKAVPQAPRPVSNEHVPPQPKGDPAPGAMRRRAVLLVGIAFAGIGIGSLAFLLTHRGDTEVPPDAALVALADAPSPDLAVVDAPAIDAPILAGPVDARARDVRDAGRTAMRDAGRDASPPDAANAPADAASLPADAGAKPGAIEKRLAFLKTAETDFEASREYMLLELAAPNDPRLPAARVDARKAIVANARSDDKKRVHLALVDHDWKAGLAICHTWSVEPPVDTVVQCTVFACILDDPELKQWASAVGYEPMLEKIGAFCERFHK